MGAEKFDMALETREIKLVWRDIPGFCRDIPEVPEKFEKKKLVFNFRSLFVASDSAIWARLAAILRFNCVLRVCDLGSSDHLNHPKHMGLVGLAILKSQRVQACCNSNCSHKPKISSCLGVACDFGCRLEL